MAIPAPATVDMRYLDAVQSREKALERNEIAARQDTKHTHNEFVRLQEELAIEFAELHNELRLLDSETKATIERVKSAVARFRTVVKKGDFARLQSKTEYWAPENRMSKQQFLRLLEDL